MTKKQYLKRWKLAKTHFSCVSRLLSHYYHTHKTSNTRCMGIFVPTKQFSATAAGCPTVSLNFDTIYPEIVSVPPGLSRTRLAPPSTSSANPKSKLLPVLWPTGSKLEVLMTSSSSSINLLEWVTTQENSLFTRLPGVIFLFLFLIYIKTFN